jgi:hypothetical protein
VPNDVPEFVLDSEEGVFVLEKGSMVLDTDDMGTVYQGLAPATT